MKHNFLYTIFKTFLLILLSIIIIGWTLSPLRNDDFWLHLKTGEYILSNLSIPEYDIFLNTPPTTPWIIHSWLSTVIFELIHATGGIKAIIYLKSICIFAGFVLIFLMCRKFTCNTALSGVTTAIIFLITAHRITLCRPIFFSYMLFPLFYLLLEGYYDTRRKSYLYILPAIIFIWANLHGGFLTGIFLLFSFSAGKLIDIHIQNRSWKMPGSPRRLAKATGLCLLASFLTPYTYRIYTHTFSFLYPTAYTGGNSEWAPIIIEQSKLYIAYIGVTILITILSIRRIRFSILFPFLLFTAMAILKSRFIFYSTVCAGYLLCSDFPYFMQMIAPLRAKIPSVARSITHYGIYVALIAALGYTAHGIHRQGLLFHPEISRSAYPFGAVQFLEKYHPECKMLNYREWGGFLIYRLYPRYQVFIDGRVPEAAGAVTRAYEAVAETHPNYTEYLDSFGIDIVVANYTVFRRSANDPIQLIAYHSDWRLVYWDDNALIYLRNTEKNADVIAQHEYQIMVPATYSDPFRTREFDLALEECKRAVEEYPSEKAYVYMGFVQKKKGEIEEALKSFHHALSINPDSIQALQNIGVIHMEQQKLNEAAVFFKKALSIDPSYPNARQCLEIIAKQQNDASIKR